MSRIVIVTNLKIALICSVRSGNVMCFQCGTNIIQRVFYIKARAMDNVQNCDRYINIPSTQTCRSH
jgi:hypothetical protein